MEDMKGQEKKHKSEGIKPPETRKRTGRKYTPRERAKGPEDMNKYGEKVQYLGPRQKVQKT